MTADVKVSEKAIKTTTKYRLKHIAAIAAVLMSGFYSARNLYDLHLFDKYVTKHVEIAANVPSVGNLKDRTVLTMETSLMKAKENLHYSRLENPAIIFKTPKTEVKMLEDILDRAIERARQITMLKMSYEDDALPENAPEWVKNSFHDLKADEHTPTIVASVARSEYGLRIASEYESLNSVVSGNTRATGKNYQEARRSLLDTLEFAGGWRSIIRFQGMNYKSAEAEVFTGYLLANMGDIEDGLKHFRKAKRLMDAYHPDKNLAIIRGTPQTEQRTIQQLIGSSITELEILDKDPAKYSTGWWKRLRYFNQSIGGQADPSILDMAEGISDRYWARAFWTGLLALGGLYFAGRWSKKYKKALEYEVKEHAI